MTELWYGEIFTLLKTTLLYRLTCIFKQAYLSSTPRLLWEVIKRLAAYQLHGNLTPGRFSVGCPHCLRRLCAEIVDPLGLWLDRSIVSPIASHRRTGSCPAVIADCFSLRTGKPKAHRPFLFSFGISLLSSFRHIPAQPLTWLMLITKAIGMCLMNGYSFFKEQTHSPPVNGKRVESFVLSTCFLTQGLNLAPHFKNFFNFSSPASMDRFTGMIVQPSIAAICS